MSVKNYDYPDADAVRAHYAALAAQYDDGANAACKRTYENLVLTHLSGAKRVIELGAGSSPLLAALDASLKVACDLSQPMLCARRAQLAAQPVVGDAMRLPFQPASFDAAFCINVAEHVPDPGQLAAEAGRVLRPGGHFLIVTPNGDLKCLLDLLERLHLKLPEGPHRFLNTAACKSLAGSSFEIVVHRCFLAFPAGPPQLVNLIDRLACGRGLFQYLLLKKRP